VKSGRLKAAGKWFCPQANRSRDAAI
jgi:hypothetical protein